ncbi:MAG: ROK family protein [Ginsengibacter sp.]
MNSSTSNIIGIDMGGTTIKGAVVAHNAISGDIFKVAVNSSGTEEDVLTDLFSLIEKLLKPNIAAIGIGVPGLVDTFSGKVFDVINIPSWKEVDLKTILEEKYKLPVSINNDANCFALGEFYFGKGIDINNMIGLTVGTGLGSGIIINGKIYNGSNGGAGEFGMVQYLDHIYEYYASGQFFKNKYGVNGPIIFEKAKANNTEALSMYNEMGYHLGKAIQMMMYAYDVELIIIGGSVKQAWPYFSQAVWQSLRNGFGFQKSLDKLRIEISELQNSGILGAAGLHYQRLT